MNAAAICRRVSKGVPTSSPQNINNRFPVLKSKIIGLSHFKFSCAAAAATFHRRMNAAAFQMPFAMHCICIVFFMSASAASSDIDASIIKVQTRSCIVFCFRPSDTRANVNTSPPLLSSATAYRPRQTSPRSRKAFRSSSSSTLISRSASCLSPSACVTVTIVTGTFVHCNQSQEGGGRAFLCGGIFARAGGRQER
jgi:hypothetical protein